jgi:hypothetical protein
MRWFRPLQLLIVCVPVALFGWLLQQELVPSGAFVVHHAVNESSPFIERLLPDQRVQPSYQDASGDWVQPIVDDPAFFFVHPHRQFDTVDAEVWFKNASVPIVELGALANVEADAYDLKPLQNLLIDNSTWDRSDSNGIVLLQREKKYQNIGDFLTDPPPRGEIATYNYRLVRPFVLEGYAPSGETRTIDVSLRGFNAFKSYVKNETLNFNIAYKDMNRQEGADTVTVFVSRDDGTPIAEERMPDDENISDDAVASPTQYVTVSVPDLPEGVYKVELRADRDIFFRTITTTQQKIVFLDNVYLGDDVGWKAQPRAVKFWTEGKNLAFTTQHADGVQVVSVGSQDVNVSEPYTRTSVIVRTDGVVAVTVPQADMMVESDGHIAFAPEQYFNPDPVRLLYNTDLDRLGVNYVIANYTSPERVGEWIVARATFDMSKIILLENKTWKFVFSTPGIARLQTQLLVGRIDMTWKRAPLVWSDVVEWLKRHVPYVR